MKAKLFIEKNVAYAVSGAEKIEISGVTVGENAVKLRRPTDAGTTVRVFSEEDDIQVDEKTGQLILEGEKGWISDDSKDSENTTPKKPTGQAQSKPKTAPKKK